MNRILPTSTPFRFRGGPSKKHFVELSATEISPGATDASWDRPSMRRRRPAIGPARFQTGKIKLSIVLGAYGKTYHSLNYLGKF